MKVLVFYVHPIQPKKKSDFHILSNDTQPHCDIVSDLHTFLTSWSVEIFVLIYQGKLSDKHQGSVATSEDSDDIESYSGAHDCDTVRHKCYIVLRTTHGRKGDIVLHI